MKFTVAAAFLAGSAAAFSPVFATRGPAGLKMSAVETEVYTFAKSEEIFAEAQTVSSPDRNDWKNQNHLAVQTGDKVF
jgi:hypothetical protein